MPIFDSPLRYPGGKAKLAEFISAIIAKNKKKGCVYAEPFSGGAGVALFLLFSEKVSRVLINDFDSRITAFWKTIVNRPTPFLDLLENTPVTIDEWHYQRDIYCHPSSHCQTKVAFATFFLNRCNRSGILVNGGPIGGFKQAGRWKIDARFNRGGLRRRIEKISLYKERIEVFGLDALEFLQTQAYPRSNRQNVFVYLDPPYYGKGPKLYLNAFDDKKHRELSNYIKRIKRFSWVMTYDNSEEIKNYYTGFGQIPFNLSYTAYERREGNEILIFPKKTVIPENINSWLPGRHAD
jgi:DNA adenine methylase